MLTYFRYALATVCFALSVGCLALWLVSTSRPDELRQSMYDLQSATIHLQSYDGIEIASYINRSRTRRANDGWYFRTSGRDEDDVGAFDNFDAQLKRDGVFGTTSHGVYFPHWYPALVFVLAGIAFLRLGRRFTVRSAIIATTVVAGLLGMAVGL